MKKLIKLLSVSVVLSLLVTLFSFPIPAFAADDILLKTADDGSASGVETTSDVFVNTGIAATVNVADAEEVLVISTFEAMEPGGSITATFQVLSTDATTSGEFHRVVSVNKIDDKGIGSIVHIFTASGGGDKTYELQHYTSGKPLTTTGTIVAIPLSTGSSVLRSEEMQVTTPVTVNATDTWLPVTGSSSTNGIVTRIASHLYVVASIESDKSAAGVATGMWKLQYDKDDSGSWTDFGYPVSRYLSSSDIGLISLVGLLQNQDAGNYKFRLMHQGTATNVRTTKANIVSVGLEDGTGYLDATQAYTAGPTGTSSSTLNAVASTTVTPYVSTKMLVHAQYEMSAAEPVTDSQYNVIVGSGGSELTSQPQRRYISGSTDVGSGSSVGLTTALTALAEYPMALNHASTGGSLSISTSDAYVVGIVLGYATSQPPVPEWPTIGLISIGFLIIGVYLLFKKRRSLIVTNQV
ncbi:hypothetical protein ACFLVZ_00870 [Chloroflexota bacterium]